MTTRRGFLKFIAYAPAAPIVSAQLISVDDLAGAPLPKSNVYDVYQYVQDHGQNTVLYEPSKLNEAIRLVMTRHRAMVARDEGRETLPASAVAIHGQNRSTNG